ncbi:MAG: 4Fe-4S binding protein [Candidatus Aminicenantales bacterium]
MGDWGRTYPLPVTGLCTGCMKCVRECPFEAVEVREEKEREGGEKRGVL